jgi:hypothetical protein
MRRFAKPLYWLIPVPRVRIPPSPPAPFVCNKLCALAMSAKSLRKHAQKARTDPDGRLLAHPVLISDEWRRSERQERVVP